MNPATIVSKYIQMSEHPDLLVYRRDFGSKFGFEAWEKTVRARCDLAGFYNKRILEVGCGLGWDAVGISVIGNNYVLATDILQSMTDTVNECLAGMRQAGHELNIEAMQADICNIDLPDGSFDGVFSSEAVEHVHDLSAMFNSCFRVLRPGGHLLIANDSNQYNSAFREATFEMWKERDGSWEHAEWLKREVRPVEHRDAKPYAVMREEIISEVSSALNDQQRSDLVKATAGLTRNEIIDAVHQYTGFGNLPTPPRFSWCRNPETGEYAERLLDPFEMRDALQAAGFVNCQLRHGFNRFPYRLVNGMNIPFLNRRLFDIRGLFILFAEKPH